MNFDIINHSIYFYKNEGFKYVEVPWLIDEEVSNYTIPPNKQNFNIKDQVLVASGEQSFLQLMKDNNLSYGKYVTMTPCFRDDELDEIHQRYFLKTELFVHDTLDNLMNMFFSIIDICKRFFSQYINVELIPINDPQPLNVSINNNISYDITDMNGIELGSYGIKILHGLSWIYATGCAEPRLSYVINKNKKVGYHDTIIPKNKIGSFMKIIEEFEEVKDAHLSSHRIMELVELSDLYGAIEHYMIEEYGMNMTDLKKMSDVTKRAFINGRR